MDYFGGIEGGGTKIKCMVAADPENIIAEITIPTQTPDETLPNLIDFFHNAEDVNQISIQGLGIAFFGPLDLDPASPTYGCITTTPKLAWQGMNILGFFEDHFIVPVTLETDVNGAALGEGAWGAARGLSNYIYITIGTGIGGGVIINKRPVTRSIHTETGHMLLQRAADDHFESVCPYHDNCVEGLASGPALYSRWKIDPKDLPASHPAWEMESYYIAQMLHDLTLACAPERIILGGGVMDHPGLIDKVRSRFVKSLNRYVASPRILDTDSFIVHPELGNLAGTLGAIALIKYR